jgi:hypothetical protein
VKPRVAGDAEAPDNPIIRGFQVKLYPSREQYHVLALMQQEMRCAHNYWVARHDEWYARCIERAVEDGALEPLPPRPEKGADRKAKRSWRKLRLSAEIGSARHCRKIEGYGWPDMRLGSEQYGLCMAHVAEALGRDLYCKVTHFKAMMSRFAVARVPKKSAAKWRRPHWHHEPSHPRFDRTMLQTRDAFPLTVGGTFGPRGWHDCELRVTRELGPIPCRAGRMPPPGVERVMGVQLSRNVRDWMASVRYRKMPPKPEPVATRRVVAVGMGLETLLHTCDVVGLSRRWDNPRGNQYSKLVAWRDEQIAELRKREQEIPPPEAEKYGTSFHIKLQNDFFKLKYSRRVRALINQEILPELGKYEEIVLGTMQRSDVQGKQCRLDEEDDGGYLSACGLLRDAIRERYPDRVSEVDVPMVGEHTAREALRKWSELHTS